MVCASLFLSLLPNSLRAEADVDIISLGDLNTQAVTTQAVGPGAGSTWFASSDSEHGTEVWIYSGSNVFLFRDTRPGPESSNPSQFTAVGSNVVYVADDGVHGPELFTTAQISATGLLADVQPGATHAAPTILGASNGWLWFTTPSTSANPSEYSSTELWVTNGTSPPIKRGFYTQNSISHVTVLRTRATLLFLAQPFGFPSGYLDLMRAEGSGAPTLIERLRTNPNTPIPTTPIYAATTNFVCYQRIDSNTEPMVFPLSGGSPGVLLTIAEGNSRPGHFVSNETDTVCFTAAAPSDHRDVWITQGATANTRMLVDVMDTANTAPSRLMMSRGNRGVFFQIGSEESVRDLYFADPVAMPVSKKYDSQVQNTQQHTIVGPAEMAYIKPEASFWQIKLANGANDFSVNLGSLFNSVSRIWNASTSSPLGTSLWVVGTTSANGEELYRRSGSSLQSLFLANSPASDSAKPRNFFPFGSNDQLFVADTSNAKGLLHRVSSGGSPASITLRTPDDSLPFDASSLPDDFTEVDGVLYFTAHDGQNRRLFRSETGHAQSAVVVSGIYDPEQLVSFQDHLFLLARITAGATSTKKVFELEALPGDTSVSLFGHPGHDATALVSAAGRLFFVEPAAGNTELLQCIATSLALETVGIFYKDTSGTGIAKLTASSGHLYFTAQQYDSTSAPRVIWSTSGNSSSLNSLPAAPITPNLLGSIGDSCLFWLEPYADNPYRLYSWDSVAGSPVECGARAPLDMPERSLVRGLPSGVEFDGWFYFASKSGALFRTNGQTLQELFDHSYFKVRLGSIAAVTGKIIFMPEHDDEPVGLWQFSPSNGQLDQFWVSPDISMPSSFTALQGKLYFTTQALQPNYSNGRTRLYRTDGTTAGTELVSSELARRNIADGPMGVYRGHLVLAPALDQVRGGLEPALLNHRPVIPIHQTQLAGGFRNQPFHFTFEQIVSGAPTDPDGDTLTPLEIRPGEGTLLCNGVLVVNTRAILPGDEFDWMPPEGQSGTLHAGTLAVSDDWQADALEPFHVEVKTPHDLWNETHFTPEELSNPAISAPDSDANGNGVPNAFEFIFGRHPKTPNATPGWSPSIATPEGGGPSVRRFAFTRAAILTEGTVLKVQCSPNLDPLSWTTISTKTENTPWDATVTVTEETQPDGRIEVRVDLPTDDTCLFLRLSVDL